MSNARLAEGCKFVNHQAPISQGASTVNGTGVDTAGYDGALFVFGVGVLGTAATVDFKVQECDDNSTWVDITGAAITQMVKATDDGKVATIDLKLGGRGNRKRYLRGVTVVAAAASLVSCQLLLYRAENAPVPGNTYTPKLV